MIDVHISFNSIHPNSLSSKHTLSLLIPKTFINIIKLHKINQIKESKAVPGHGRHIVVMLPAGYNGRERLYVY